LETHYCCFLDCIPFVVINFGLERVIKNEYMLLIISIVIFVIYTTYFHGSQHQATPGKMLLGIKVVGYQGQRISYARAFARPIASCLSLLIFAIGYLMAAFTRRKQALHDVLCDTYVINKSSNQSIRFLVVFRFF